MFLRRFLPPHLRVILLAVLVPALLVVAGCGGDDDADETSPGGDEVTATPGDETSAAGGTRDAAEVRYLAIGDSLSQGVGADDIETGAFPAQLAERWRDAGCTVELLNAGISGYTAAQMLDEQVPQIDEFGPTVITFQSGANDIANGVTEDDYRGNVAAVLDAAVGSGAQVYVLLQNEWFRAPDGPYYGGTPELRDAYDVIMLEETDARGVEVMDLRPLYKAQADADAWIDDGIHPTEDAYTAWADALATMIPLPCQP